MSIAQKKTRRKVNDIFIPSFSTEKKLVSDIHISTKI